MVLEHKLKCFNLNVLLVRLILCKFGASLNGHELSFLQLLQIQIHHQHFHSFMEFVGCVRRKQQLPSIKIVVATLLFTWEIDGFAQL